MKATPARRGFTLVETMIAVSISLVVMGLVIPGYQRTARLQRVVTSLDRVKQGFIQAKSNAQNGKKDCSACSCNTGSELALQGWRVRVVNTGGTPPVYQYVVEGVCSNNTYPNNPLTAFYPRSENLPAGVTISINPAPAAPILFKPGGQGIHPGLAGGGVFTVTAADSFGNTRSFTVDGAGGVQ